MLWQLPGERSSVSDYVPGWHEEFHEFMAFKAGL